MTVLTILEPEHPTLFYTDYKSEVLLFDQGNLTVI